MGKPIGHIIKSVAKSKGFTLESFGKEIHMSKQGVASLYKRKNIEVELLKEIVTVLDYDFFAQYYEEEPLLKFKQEEISVWTKRIDLLNTDIEYKEKLLEKNEEILSLQRKYISELEDKINRLGKKNEN